MSRKLDISVVVKDAICSYLDMLVLCILQDMNIRTRHPFRCTYLHFYKDLADICFSLFNFKTKGNENKSKNKALNLFMGLFKYNHFNQ